MRVAFINTTADGIAAPSRLMLEIVRGVIDSGGEAMIAWGRGDYRGDRRAYTYKIGNPVSIAGHYALATISDAEGLGSLGDTRKAHEGNQKLQSRSCTSSQSAWSLYQLSISSRKPCRHRYTGGHHHARLLAIYRSLPVLFPQQMPQMDE